MDYYDVNIKYEVRLYFAGQELCNKVKSMGLSDTYIDMAYRIARAASLGNILYALEQSPESLPVWLKNKSRWCNWD